MDSEKLYKTKFYTFKQIQYDRLTDLLNLGGLINLEIKIDFTIQNISKLHNVFLSVFLTCYQLSFVVPDTIVTGSCPDGFTPAKYGVGNCYLISPYEPLKQFGQSGMDCWSLYGAMLLTIENANEEEYVASFLYNNTGLGGEYKRQHITHFSNIIFLLRTFNIIELCDFDAMLSIYLY